VSLKKAKFFKFGVKKDNLATLFNSRFASKRPQVRTWGAVEFALQSQHETSSDFGIQLPVSDITDFEVKTRKRPRSLSLLTMNGRDMDEYWETKVLQRNGLSPKRIKLEQYED